MSILAGSVRRLISELEHFSYVLFEALARRRGFGVSLQVVVTIRQRKAALAEAGDHARRILRIRLRGEPEQHIDSLAMQPRHFGGQIRTVTHSLNPIEFRSDRSDALPLDCRRVHTTAEIVADLLIERSTRRL